MTWRSWMISGWWGLAIARWLTTAGRLRVFNLVMGILIAVSVVGLVRH